MPSTRLTLVRELRDRTETRQQHARAASSGTEVRIAHGVYVAREDWEPRTPLERHLLRMQAYSRARRRPPVFSHWSAAVLHRLALIGPVPEKLHISVGDTRGGRSARAVTAHSTAVPDADVVSVDGLLVTSLARTVVDVAATYPMADAVAMADAALRSGVAGASLVEAWERALPFRGHRRALDMIGFADARSESPLESVSRVSMHRSALAPPELQMPFRDRRGRIGYVDFAWPGVGIVGEADGDVKYLDPALRGGRSADRVVLDEKIREDRLRALGLRVVRWRWDTATRPPALAALLTAAGVPRCAP